MSNEPLIPIVWEVPAPTGTDASRTSSSWFGSVSSWAVAWWARWWGTALLTLLIATGISLAAFVWSASHVETTDPVVLTPLPMPPVVAPSTPEAVLIACPSNARMPIRVLDEPVKAVDPPPSLARPVVASRRVARSRPASPNDLLAAALR